MNSKISIKTIIFGIALGALILAVAALSGGNNMDIVIPVAIGMFIAGPIIALSYNKKGKIPDSECDERETVITEKAMKATFYLMTFVLFGYWAYDISRTGQILSFSTLFLFLFFGSFIVMYFVYKKKY